MKKKFIAGMCLVASAILLTACGGAVNSYTTVNRWGYEQISETAVYRYEYRKPETLPVGVNYYYPVGTGTYTTSISSVTAEDQVDSELLSGRVAAYRVEISLLFEGAYVLYRQENGVIIESQRTDSFQDAFTVTGYLDNNLRTIATVRKADAMTSYLYGVQEDGKSLETIKDFTVTTKYSLRDDKTPVSYKIEGEEAVNSYTFKDKLERNAELSGYVFDNDLMYYHVRSIRELVTDEKTYTLTYQLYDYAVPEPVQNMTLTLQTNSETETNVFNYNVDKDNEFSVNGVSQLGKNVTCNKVSVAINKTQSGPAMNIWMEKGDTVTYKRGDSTNETECKKILRVEKGTMLMTLQSYENHSLKA